MPENKRKFNKKNATTFALINRPLHSIGEDGDDQDDQGNLKVATEEELLARKEEEHKFGIYYNDNYDYMRHLRDVSTYQGNLEPVEKFRMGSSASDVLFDAVSVVSGRSNRLHPLQPLHPARDPTTTYPPRSTVSPPPDPELLATMTDTFDASNPDNLLDDDFISQAGGAPHHLPARFYDSDSDEYPGVEDDVDPTAMIHKNGLVGAWIDHQEPGEEVDGKETAELVREWVRLRGEPLEEDEGVTEEKGSRVSKYSMSSSVIRRSEGLKTLDQHFEQMFGQYDEEEIGGLDLDDHEGRSENLVLRTILAEQAKKNAPADSVEEDEADDSDSSSESGVDEVALKFRYEDGGREELVPVVMEEDDDTFDCQSILSHRSDRSYQPKLITVPGKPKPIRLNKIGFPVEKPEKQPPQVDDEDEDVLSLISSLSVARSKNETSAERNIRKHALRDLRRERRVEKKANKLSFGQEKVRQERMEASVEGRMRTVAMV